MLAGTPMRFNLSPHMRTLLSFFCKIYAILYGTPRRTIVSTATGTLAPTRKLPRLHGIETQVVIGRPWRIMDIWYCSRPGTLLVITTLTTPISRGNSFFRLAAANG